jgi:hypothetical protein
MLWSTPDTVTPQRECALSSQFAGSITGIGSLPHRAADEAVALVARRCHEIPFWPQLPQVSEWEGIIGQGLTVLGDLIEPRANGYGYEVKPGTVDAVVAALHGSTGALDSVGFAAFRRALDQHCFASARMIKGQIEGPITLATHLFYRGRPFIADESLFAAVAFHVSQLVCWQLNELCSYGKPLMLFVDEPALCLTDSFPDGIPLERRLSALGAILRDIRSRGAVAGLHCCAARPFARMLAAAPDIVSFDAHRELEYFFSYPEAIKFIERGGWVAYGLVPNSADLVSLEPAALFNRWLIAASMTSDPQLLAQRSLITATCGLGLLDQNRVEQSFRLSSGVGELIRRLAGI